MPRGRVALHKKRLLTLFLDVLKLRNFQRLGQEWGNGRWLCEHVSKCGASHVNEVPTQNILA